MARRERTMADRDGPWTMSGKGRVTARAVAPRLSKAQRSAVVVIGGLERAAQKDRRAVESIEKWAGRASDRREVDRAVVKMREVAARLADQVDPDHEWAHVRAGFKADTVARAAAAHPAAVVATAAARVVCARRKLAVVEPRTTELAETVHQLGEVLAEYRMLAKQAADGLVVAELDYAAAEKAARPKGCPLIDWLPSEMLALILARVGPISWVRDGRTMPTLPYVCRAFRECWDMLRSRQTPVWNPWTLPLEMRAVTGDNVDFDEWALLPVWTEPTMGRARLGDLRLCGNGAALFLHRHTDGRGVAFMHGDRLIPLDPGFVVAVHMCAMARRGPEVAVFCVTDDFIRTWHAWRVNLDDGSVRSFWGDLDSRVLELELHALTGAQFGSFVLSYERGVKLVHQIDGAASTAIQGCKVGPTAMVDNVVFSVHNGLARYDFDAGEQVVLAEHGDHTDRDILRVHVDRTSWPGKTLIISTAVDGEHRADAPIHVHVLDDLLAYVGTLKVVVDSGWQGGNNPKDHVYVYTRRRGKFGLKIGHHDGYLWHSAELCAALRS